MSEREKSVHRLHNCASTTIGMDSMNQGRAVQLVVQARLGANNHMTFVVHQYER